MRVWSRRRVAVGAGLVGLAGVVAVAAFGALTVLGGADSGPPAPDPAIVRPAVAAVADIGGGASADLAESDFGSSAVLCVDTERSLVRWRGTKIGGKHEGIVRLADGRLAVDENAGESRVVGGSFTVDMRTIAITDVPPDQVEARRQLRSHLAHEEFFGVERFPTARFEITAVEGGEHGIHRVSGDLAIRDSVHNVTFEATAPVVSPEGVWATADFSIDRNLWGVEFDGRTSSLRNAIVDDLIQLEITLVAEAGGCSDAS